LGAVIPIKNIYKHTLEHLNSGADIVLATVIRSRGSTPQKPGSSALFGEEGLITGTVGGGLLEGEVQNISEGVIISGVSDHYYFNLDTDQGKEGAICGGEAIVLIDANPVSSIKALESMIQSLSNRISGRLITLISKQDGDGKRIERHWIRSDDDHLSLTGVDSNIKKTIEEGLQQKESSGLIEIELSDSVADRYEFILIEHINPLPRLVIAGAGHIGRALAHIGTLLDFEITVIDDRPEFADAKNIPDADHLVVRNIGRALGEISFDSDSYVVIVTRGHQHDAEALRSCITSQAAYIGMIGSSHKVGVIKKRFLDEGWATPEQWSRVHTPIGIPIGSKTVQEIAIIIAALLIVARNKLKNDE